MTEPKLQANFELNISRVRKLLQVYGGLSGKGKGRRPVNSSDILRAATVLLHAALEDVLRTLEGEKLPSSDRDALNNIPLTGTGDRPQKFFLGELARHRDKSVAEVIDESVQNYLGRRSYNGVSDIAGAPERIGIRADPYTQHFELLSQMIERRHHIVHQADRHDQPGTGHHKTRSLSKAEVERWVREVERFVTGVLGAA